MNLTQFNRILFQTLLLPVLALAFVASILTWQVLSAQKTVDAIQVTGENMASITLAEKLVIDEETALRGYQVTGDGIFLQPFQAAEAPFTRTLARLRQNLIAQKQDPRPIDAIVGAHETWHTSFANPLIATLQAGGRASDLRLNMDGKQRMDNLRSRFASLFDAQLAMRNKESLQFQKQVRHTIQALIFLALSAGLFISVFTFTRLRRVSEVYQNTLDNLRHNAQATHEAGERLRATLTSIGDGVIVCDIHGRVETLNTVAEQLTGWTQTEALHKELHDIFHIVSEDKREPLEDAVSRVIRLRRIDGAAGHTLLIRGDGSEIQIDDSGAPIYDHSGTLTGVVMVFRDVGQQRKAQQALIATEKLATAGRLAATIAHEMHNPLDSVVNLLYLIRDEKDTAVSEHYLDLAQQELGRMGQVTRAMLGLYRESKAPVPIDIKEILESVLVLLDRQFKKAELTITTDLPERLQIDGFPAELRQVFTNMLANAAEASSPHGTVRLAASQTGPRKTAGGSMQPGVVIQIEDNGSGIEPASLEHVFTPFFTTKGEQGTGLGLWVSRGIVEKHGGTIKIESRTGADDHGTTISLFLPRVATTN